MRPMHRRDRLFRCRRGDDHFQPTLDSAQIPNFIAVHDSGIDHLFSIERIQWNAKSDQIRLGKEIDLLEDEHVHQSSDSEAQSNRRTARLLADDHAVVGDAFGGSDGDDRLIGTGLGETIDAQGGDDTLYGGGGNDTLFGGAGSDGYVYLPGDGDDVIIDLAGAAGFDELLLTGGIGVADLAVFRVDGRDLLLSLPGGSVLVSGFFAGDSAGIERVVFDHDAPLSRSALDMLAVDLVEAPGETVALLMGGHHNHAAGASVLGPGGWHDAAGAPIALLTRFPRGGWAMIRPGDRHVSRSTRRAGDRCGHVFRACRRGRCGGASRHQRAKTLRARSMAARSGQSFASSTARRCCWTTTRRSASSELWRRARPTCRPVRRHGRRKTRRSWHCEQLVQGKSVSLATSGRAQDRYGRKLAHLFIDKDGERLWVQGEMLSSGNARAYGLPGSYACMRELMTHERAAREAGSGIWGNAAYGVRSGARGWRSIATAELVRDRCWKGCEGDRNQGADIRELRCGLEARFHRRHCAEGAA